MILNGPNLNLLGVREPDIYGTTTPAQIKENCEHNAKRLGLRFLVEISVHQPNLEGELVDLIQSARQSADWIIASRTDGRQLSVVPRQAICLDALSSQSRSPGVSNVPHDQGEYKQRRRPCEQRSDYHRLCCGHDGSLMSRSLRPFGEPSIPLGNCGTAGLFLVRSRWLRRFVEPSPIGFVADRKSVV